MTDGKGNLATGTLSIEGKKAGIEVTEIRENLPGFSTKLHIAIAPTKNIDRIEFFVEKAVEMGISEISIIATEKRNVRTSILIRSENRLLLLQSKVSDFIFRSSMIW